VKKILLYGVVLVIMAIAAAAYFFFYRPLVRDPVLPLFAAECAGCHGESMQGSDSGPSLVGDEFVLGKGVADLVQQIAAHPREPSSDLEQALRVLDDADLRGLAILIGETSTERKYRTFEVEEPLQLPAEPVRTKHHSFRVETLTSDLHPLPFSFAPLPDGGFLVSEKLKGLRHVSVGGEVSDYIQGLITQRTVGCICTTPIAALTAMP